MAMRVALYVRVSTQRQAQAQTVEQQVERLAGHARQQGWDVPPDQIVRDDGHSGASLRRPGLDRLRDRAAARSLDLSTPTSSGAGATSVWRPAPPRPWRGRRRKPPSWPG